MYMHKIKLSEYNNNTQVRDFRNGSISIVWSPATDMQQMASTVAVCHGASECESRVVALLLIY